MTQIQETPLPHAEIMAVVPAPTMGPNTPLQIPVSPIAHQGFVEKCMTQGSLAYSTPAIAGVPMVSMKMSILAIGTAAMPHVMTIATAIAPNQIGWAPATNVMETMTPAPSPF
jgi:hypothetical protein